MTLEERLSVLEKEMADLKRQLEGRPSIDEIKNVFEVQQTNVLNALITTFMKRIKPECFIKH